MIILNKFRCKYDIESIYDQLYIYYQNLAGKIFCAHLQSFQSRLVFRCVTNSLHITLNYYYYHCYYYCYYFCITLYHILIWFYFMLFLVKERVYFFGNLNIGLEKANFWRCWSNAAAFFFGPGISVAKGSIIGEGRCSFSGPISGVTRKESSLWPLLCSSGIAGTRTQATWLFWLQSQKIRPIRHNSSKIGLANGSIQYSENARDATPYYLKFGTEPPMATNILKCKISFAW